MGYRPEQYYFWIADTKHSYQAITAFKCAEEYFDFKILSVQTDNGSELEENFIFGLLKRIFLIILFLKRVLGGIAR